MHRRSIHRVCAHVPHARHSRVSAAAAVLASVSARAFVAGSQAWASLPQQALKHPGQVPHADGNGNAQPQKRVDPAPFFPPTPGNLPRPKPQQPLLHSNPGTRFQNPASDPLPLHPPPSQTSYGTCDFGHGDADGHVTPSSQRLSTAATEPVEPLPDLTTIPTSSIDPFAYCSDLVRKSDYEQYLISLLQPSPSVRQSLWALRALNVELARVRETVSNDQLGRIKMQWWRDAIDGCFKGNPGQSPTMIALYRAMQKTPLSKTFFVRLVRERSANLSVAQYPSLASLEQYAEHTASSLLYLHLQLLRVQSLHADHAASHLGKAVGISTVLRGAAWQARERRWYLPADIMAKHGVSQEAVFREGPSPALSDAVLEIATLAHAHLRHTRELIPTAPKESLPAFLSIVPTERFLKRLEDVDFNLFDGRLYAKDWKLPAVMWWSSRKGLQV
ncbi:hypothetical protein M427DRAFT_36357 [Gonapodya prolifera JEL478]|uniref:15-cis-phytoene synthase n=1 Tax=Gonapodya prolifera (strain JEL478) TaxID=1344416 RepID=A0A139A2L8_GONPJ|nr:hypothetical protein M427DRAFT_36357 [Gonapodya prolifera JEL478]|eukprot:KXS11027.1 hypothetical protein M427DRAFT_36357 [Gonapodya prolifera JEL478]